MQDNIGQFWSVLSVDALCQPRRCRWKDVSDDAGCEVKDFAELTSRVALLSFHNPGLNLFFRGQTQNFPLVPERGDKLKTFSLAVCVSKEYLTNDERE